jgi:hypothetical protein
VFNNTSRPVVGPTLSAGPLVSGRVSSGEKATAGPRFDPLTESENAWHSALVSL